MKKWYEVYYEIWDKTNRKWALGKMNFFKFICCLFYFRTHNNLVDDLEDFGYVSPSRINWGESKG